MPKLSTPNYAYLNIEIKGNNYKIPLARSMKVKTLRKVLHISKLDEAEQFEFLCDLFAPYLGQELIDDLTEIEIEELYVIWTKANSETGEVSLGES